jgi:hypothetical protein
VSHMRYKLGFYIPEDGNNHSHNSKNLECYIKFTYSYMLAALFVVVFTVDIANTKLVCNCGLSVTTNRFIYYIYFRSRKLRLTTVGNPPC